MKQATCHPQRISKFKNGLCKNCYDKALLKSNPVWAAKNKAIQRAWVVCNKKLLAERQKTRYYGRNIQKKFNISQADFDVMMQAQNGRCKICKQEPARRKLDIDHNHITGKVRGLLCSLCNTGLGKFRDNASLLRLAAFYLEEIT